MEFLSIHQAALSTGMTVHTLRYYERIGLLVTARTPGGVRRYSQGDLGWLKILHCLRETGMPIQTMKQYALLVHEKANPDQMQNLLEAHREVILKNMEEQRQYLAAIEQKIAIYRNQ
jgi:DNA-binding transcriptional MerR regulator